MQLVGQECVEQYFIRLSTGEYLLHYGDSWSINQKVVK